MTNPSTSLPRLREAVPGDASAIARLKSTHHRQGSKWLKNFSWQFTDNPAYSTDHPIGWVLETNDKQILGHEMSMPQRFWVNQREVYIGISCDTFLDPTLRGYGFGEKLFDAYFEGQRGSLVLSTTANEITEYIWRKANCYAIGDLNIKYEFPYRKSFTLQKTLGTRIKPPIIGKIISQIAGRITDFYKSPTVPSIADEISWEKVEHDDIRLESTWLANREHYSITTVRDKRYRRWRYKDVPGPRPFIALVTNKNQPSLSAWFVIRRVKRGRLTVVSELIDVFGPLGQPDFQAQVLACAINAGNKTGATVLEVLGLHPEWRHQLSNSGMQHSVLPSTQFMCRNMGEFDDSLLQNPASWHLCAVDGDAAI